ERCEVAGRALDHAEGSAAAVVERRAEQFMILLIKAVEPYLQIVSLQVRTEIQLTAGIVRSAVVGGYDRIAQGTVIVSAVVVIKRRNRHQHCGAEGMHPG